MPPLFVLLIIAVVLWALGQFPTLDATIVKIIRVVLIVIAVVIAGEFLLGYLGLNLGSYYPYRRVR